MQKERIVFHFNKAHNSDPDNIPPWVIKYKGQSFYVWHMVSTIGFNTKETPGNEHTRGSLMFRGSLETKDENGKLTAYIS